MSNSQESRAERKKRWAEESRDRLRQKVRDNTATHEDERDLLHQEKVIEYNKRLLGE